MINSLNTKLSDKELILKAELNEQLEKNKEHDDPIKKVKADLEYQDINSKEFSSGIKFILNYVNYFL